MELIVGLCSVWAGGPSGYTVHPNVEYDLVPCGISPLFHGTAEK